MASRAGTVWTNTDFGSVMGTFSIWHWIIVIALILVLFGRGKVSELMGDVAKGIKSFKKGMAEDEDAPTVIDQKPGQTITATRVEEAPRV